MLVCPVQWLDLSCCCSLGTGMLRLGNVLSVMGVLCACKMIIAALGWNRIDFEN